MAEAIAVTREEYDRMRRNGGGGGGSNESALAPVWKAWAKDIVSSKLDVFNKIAEFTPKQFLENNVLKREFETVSDSERVACQVIRDRSAVFKVPGLKTLKSLLPY